MTEFDPLDENSTVAGARAIRFGCGALFGVVVGVGLALELASEDASVWIGAIVGSILVCGVLSMRYGDRFYELFGWERPWRH